jgi:hypothetical protein
MTRWWVDCDDGLFAGLYESETVTEWARSARGTLMVPLVAVCGAEAREHERWRHGSGNRRRRRFPFDRGTRDEKRE